jgi:nucleotide-binding universal stress UspA family protein
MTTLPATPVSVLAAIDFSKGSSLVVQLAVEATRQLKAEELHFLHVCTAARSAADLEGRRTEFEEWLAARLHGADGVPETVRVVAHEASGNPADVIIATASDLFASLVVVGTHGRTGLQRMVLGSVAETVVRDAGCPVLVARARTPELRVPRIEPPCPRCVETRSTSEGRQPWCERHTERHERRHTYQNDRHQTWINQRITL